MRHEIAFGMAAALAAGAVCTSGASRAQDPGGVTAAVEIVGPFYACGPQPVEVPRIRPRFRPRYDGPRYDEQGSGDAARRFDPRYDNESRRYRGYTQRGEAYGGYRYRDHRFDRAYGDRRYAYRGYASRGYDRNAKAYRYRIARPPQLALRDQYAGRIITPQWNGRWRDLGPVDQLTPY